MGRTFKENQNHDCSVNIIISEDVTKFQVHEKKV